MADPDAKPIEDREKTSKTQLTDQLPKSQIQIGSREDTLRNLEDKPKSQ